MKISELQELLDKAREEYGDVEVVINKHYYTKVTEVIPIFKRETPGVTVSAVEVY